MSSVVTYPVHISFSTNESLLKLQSCYRGPTLRLYYNQGAAYVVCHRAVFDSYLKDTVQLKGSACGVVFGFVDSPNAVACKQFVTCLYLRHTDQFNRKGELRNSYVFIEPLVQNLIELARYHKLPWLETVCLKQRETPSEPAYGVCLLKNNRELVCVGQNYIESMGVPLYLKALTCSTNGETWYALSAPHPELCKIWIRLPRANYWTAVAVLDPTPLKAPNHYQLCLSDQCHLHVLQDRRRWTCFNASTKTQHPIVELDVDAVLVETGDGSLPPTALINNRANQLVTCTLDPFQFVHRQRRPVSFSPHRRGQPGNKVYSIQTIQPAPVVATTTTFDCRPQVVDVAGVYNSIRNAIDRGGDVKTRQPAVTPQADGVDDGEMWKIDRQTELKEGHKWVRALAFKGGFYAQKQNGEWWSVQTRRRCGGWSLEGDWALVEHLSPNVSLTWNPQTDSLSRVSLAPPISDEYFQLSVNDHGLLVDPFNPLYVDESFMVVTHASGKTLSDHKKIGGLSSLWGMTVSPGVNGKLDFEISSSNCPLALRVFLQHLTPDIATKLLEGYDVTYLAGGAEYVEKLDPKTGTLQVKLYANNKTRDSHLVLADNLKVLLTRYFTTQPKLSLLGSMGSFNNVNKVTEYYDE
ncbi:protein ORF122 [Lake sturgeon herpesvirus]|nr:protein ORF122 [Lake sturgeon herpesvirus]